MVDSNTPPQSPLYERAAKQQTIELLKQALELHQKGQMGQAFEMYKKILSIEPKHFDALHMVGVIFLQTNQSKIALDFLKKASEVNSKNSDVFYNLGLALDNTENYEQAVAAYENSISLNSKNYKALNNKSKTLHLLGRYADALDSSEQALSINPEYSLAHNQRGNALRSLMKLDEAIASYNRAIHIKPDFAEAHNNRGAALIYLKRYDEALACYDHAIHIKPDFAEAHNNRGAALIDLKRFHEALASYNRAIAINPEYSDAHFNKSLALLLTNKFQQGWELYEWRWKRENKNLKLHNFTQPLLLDSDDITNKTILLHAEQGLGDTIQFCRYAKLVKERGARVLLEAPKALVELLKTLDGVDELIEKGKPLPAFDYHCPLLSLPLAFKTELETIPNAQSYLSVDHKKRKDWANKLGKTTKRRVGLVWSGNTQHKNDHNRSMTLQELLPYLPEDYEYVSLQKEVREDEKDILAKCGIKHFGEQLNDFADTAALCDLMDIVISVDTSVAHLAGALGKKTWILLSYSPDWRWLLDRDDSPWYPTVKLYRQDKIGDWSRALEKIKSDLINHK